MTGRCVDATTRLPVPGCRVIARMFVEAGDAVSTGADGRFALPPGSRVVHIGGWKKLVDQQVSKERFNVAMAEIFGIKEDAVVDFYVHTARLEVEAFDNAVTDWEKQRYFERI